jgi:hypothetical protein
VRKSSIKNGVPLILHFISTLLRKKRYDQKTLQEAKVASETIKKQIKEFNALEPHVVYTLLHDEIVSRNRKIERIADTSLQAIEAGNLAQNKVNEALQTFRKSNGSKIRIVK